MGVYIRGMEMPTSCNDCPCFCEEYFYCRAKEGDNIGLGNRPKDCPLVPVQPHGRLIDADKMRESIRWQAGFLKLMGIEDLSDIAEEIEKGFLQEIANAPTIIEAEEGE